MVYWYDPEFKEKNPGFDWLTGNPEKVLDNTGNPISFYDEKDEKCYHAIYNIIKNSNGRVTLGTIWDALPDDVEHDFFNEFDRGRIFAMIMMMEMGNKVILTEGDTNYYWELA